MKTLIACIVMLFGSSSWATEQLIVFTQPHASPLADAFAAQQLPELLAAAEQMGIAVEVVDATAGAPAAVHLTPLIVYQNHRGRSIYQGRYTTLPRVTNFIRTARVMPKAEDALTLTNLPVMTQGRVQVGSPIKITDLNGHTPEGFDQAAFKAEMLAALGHQLKQYQMQASAEFGRSDRLFYWDFYPYRSEDDKLYVSVALFSQFHCHEPIFVQMDQPVSGAWDDRAAVFAQAAALLEAEVIDQLKTSANGDGFDAVGPEVRLASFDDLGLTLPDPPANAAEQDFGDLTLGNDWEVDAGALSAGAMIQFAFAPPLDGYAGEVKSLSGQMTLGEDGALATTTGQFTVQTSTLTMGEVDLDMHIHDGLIFVEEHPTASFTIEKVQSDYDTLAFGRITPVTMTGTFTLMGKTVPLTVGGQIDAYIGEDGEPRLLFTGVWKLVINDVWGLEGPPGPPESQNTMNFLCQIVLRAGG